MLRKTRSVATTIQNWANNIYNLVTKRAIVEENGLMEGLMEMSAQKPI